MFKTLHHEAVVHHRATGMCLSQRLWMYWCCFDRGPTTNQIAVGDIRRHEIIPPEIKLGVAPKQVTPLGEGTASNHRLPFEAFARHIHIATVVPWKPPEDPVIAAGTKKRCSKYISIAGSQTKA